MNIASYLKKIFEFFNQPAFTLGEQALTYGTLLLIPTLLLVGYLTIRVIARFIFNQMTARNINPDLIQMIRRVFYFLAFVILGVTILDLINVPLTAFAFVSGAFAIGIGFGAQNIINNFISGWILMWERPIRIGDFLEVGSDKGTVEAINIRSTRIRRTDGVHMLIPNSALLENTVVNWTLVNNLSRTTIRVGVAYGSPPKLTAQLIEQAISEHKEVLKNPEAAVIFEDFGDNALIFDCYFWLNARAETSIRIVRSDIRFRIEELMNENDIVIAFPQRDIHVDGAVTVIHADTKSDHNAGA